MRFKKKISAVLSIALVFSLALQVVFAENGRSPFMDVPTTHWAFPDILTAYGDGVMTGTYFNEATGERRFSPNSPLTMAEFTVMLVRAFYADELPAHTQLNWYNREYDILNAHGVYGFMNSGSSNVSQFMFTAISRNKMAVMIAGVMKDKGAAIPSTAEINQTLATISDRYESPAEYHEAIAICFKLGIINGMSTNPIRFAGNSYMQRDAAAAVYVRIKNELAKMEAGQPTVTPKPSGNVVGTMSSTPVTLSIATHAPITDYWSMQSAQIQNITDRDAFNAACQTIKDSKMIMSEGEFQASVNLYYNYAVVPRTLDVTRINVNQAMMNTMGGGGTYGSKSQNGYTLYTVANNDAAMKAAYAPYVAKVTPDMTARQKVELAIKSVVDKIDYVSRGNATWTNGVTQGNCESYAMMTQQLLAAMGIPSINVTATVADGGGHNWLQVLIPGEGWKIVDGTMAESGFSNGGIMSFAEHERVFGYSRDKNDADMYFIARALIDAAYVF